jgi:hypothetical protein
MFLSNTLSLSLKLAFYSIKIYFGKLLKFEKNPRVDVPKYSVCDLGLIYCLVDVLYMLTKGW